MTSIALSLSHLTKRYRADLPPVLHDLTFDVRDNELLAIVGHSGTGKSTLLRCMAGLIPVTSGEVTLHGRPVSGPPADLAVVFQDYSRSLMPWMRVLDNVVLPLRRTTKSRAARRSVAESALASVGLSDTGHLYPWQLSGGMQQRVAIARAIACQPSVMLMDEPFASVDAQTRAELEDLALNIRKEYGMTMIVVTHDIDEAVYLGNRVVLLAGRPASIKAEVEIELPATRDQITTKAEPAFLKYRTEVMTLIREEIKHAPPDAPSEAPSGTAAVNGAQPGDATAVLR